MEKRIISHVRMPEGSIQTNEEHQEGVAGLACDFAAVFDMGEWGRVLGLLHDKGKEKRAFQQHIIRESGLDSFMKVDGDSRHAYVGALVARQLFPRHHLLMDNVLMGHHRGLYDDGDMKEVMKKTMPNDVTVERIDAQLELSHIGIQRQDIHHLQRMLYSCLVDADYLDTEAFMQPEQSKLRGGHSTISPVA